MNTLNKRSGQRRFFYHYNKPESKRQGCNVLTLHWKGKCHLVNDIVCHLPTETHKQKRQPHCVVRGWATEVIHLYLKRDSGHTAVIH